MTQVGFLPTTSFITEDNVNRSQLISNNYKSASDLIQVILLCDFMDSLDLFLDYIFFTMIKIISDVLVIQENLLTRKLPKSIE